MLAKNKWAINFFFDANLYNIYHYVLYEHIGRAWRIEKPQKRGMTIKTEGGDSRY